MCDGRVGVIQSVTEEPLSFCPYCGLEVRRVVSRAAIKIARDASPDRAGSRGFTTYRKVEEGKWEKLSGDGADMLVGSDEDMRAIREEKKPRKVYEVDENT